MTANRNMGSSISFDLILKARPEDFIVDERADISVLPRGQYCVYRLRKRGWNTLDALAEIAKRRKLPSGKFSYGGKKDRHALTTQYISFAGRRIPDIVEKDFSLEFHGFSNRPMGPDLIAGNDFQITIRRLTATQLKRPIEHAQGISTHGFLNYFDDQRFRGYDPVQGFLAEKILCTHLNGALKLYMTAVYAKDTKNERERKEFFYDHWREWDACLLKAVTDFERRVFTHLCRNPNQFLPLLKLIPREELSMSISAYQSFLWNEILRRIMTKIYGQSCYFYPGIAGSYLFPSPGADHSWGELQDLFMPTASAKARMPKQDVEQLYQDLLKERSVTTSMFNKFKLRQSFFKSTARAGVVHPDEFSQTVADDELYKGFRKWVLKFFLPRGSYGTMLVKYLFSLPSERKQIKI